MTITTVQSSVTKTAAFDGASIDISSFTGDWTLRVRVSKFSPAAGIARFTLNDSVDAFTAQLAGPSFHIVGGLTNDSLAGGPQQPVTYAFNKRDWEGMRFGTASAVVRLSLTAISGSSASITYSAWLETM
jgi:hypothetical protein